MIDEYYEADSLDPTRLPVIRDRIATLAQAENLTTDLGNLESRDGFPEFLSRADSYLCELKEAQIRDGLHIFGCAPEGRLLRDLVVAIARHPDPDRMGLTRAIARDWHWDFDPLTADPGMSFAGDPNLRTVGKAMEAIEQHAAELIDAILADQSSNPQIAQPKLSKGKNLPQELELQLGAVAEHLRGSAEKSFVRGPGTASVRRHGDGRWGVGRVRSSEVASERKTHSGETSPTSGFIQNPDLYQSLKVGTATHQELAWIRDCLLPALQNTNTEITNLLCGLNGQYIPSGPSGAPTRGRPDVLPTGRNFYAVDPRGLPTESAWDVGRKAAETLIERHTQENGEYPQTLGLSVWGTSTMRTGGDDIAEALALMGVRPVWDGPSRRVTDFEILPLSVLERPRVDVTLRVSGFFRDAFPNLIDLFDTAARAVADLDETTEANPLAANVRADAERWQAEGVTKDVARDRASYRVFGSKPGAYGAGLQGLIEAQNWQGDSDLARAYLNWSSYAYGQSWWHSSSRSLRATLGASASDLAQPR